MRKFLFVSILAILSAIPSLAQEPKPATPPTTAVYVVADSVEGDSGQTIVKQFVSDINASSEFQVVPTNPPADAPDANVFHLLSQVNKDGQSITFLYAALRHVKGSNLLIYIGAYSTSVKPGEEAEVTANIEQLTLLVFRHADNEPDFQVTITPKVQQTPTPTKPSAYKSDKGLSKS